MWSVQGYNIIVVHIVHIVVACLVLGILFVWQRYWFDRIRNYSKDQNVYTRAKTHTPFSGHHVLPYYPSSLGLCGMLRGKSNESYDLKV